MGTYLAIFNVMYLLQKSYHTWPLRVTTLARSTLTERLRARASSNNYLLVRPVKYSFDLQEITTVLGNLRFISFGLKESLIF